MAFPCLLRISYLSICLHSVFALTARYPCDLLVSVLIILALHFLDDPMYY